MPAVTNFEPHPNCVEVAGGRRKHFSQASQIEFELTSESFHASSSLVGTVTGQFPAGSTCLCIFQLTSCSTPKMFRSVLLFGSGSKWTKRTGAESKSGPAPYREVQSCTIPIARSNTGCDSRQLLWPRWLVRGSRTSRPDGPIEGAASRPRSFAAALLDTGRWQLAYNSRD
jgi:hypothetical protein